MRGGDVGRRQAPVEARAVRPARYSCCRADECGNDDQCSRSGNRAERESLALPKAGVLPETSWCGSTHRGCPPLPPRQSLGGLVSNKPAVLLGADSCTWFLRPNPARRAARWASRYPRLGARGGGTTASGEGVI